MRRSSLKYLFSKQAPIDLPQIVERDRLIADFIEGEREERCRSARMEFNRNQPLKFPGVEDSWLAMRSSQRRATIAPDSSTLIPGVGSELILGEVDHQVCLAVRQDAFEPEWKGPVVIMERLDERLKGGRARPAGKVIHGGQHSIAGDWANGVPSPLSTPSTWLDFRVDLS